MEHDTPILLPFVRIP